MSWKDRVSIQTVCVVMPLRHVFLGLLAIDDLGAVRFIVVVSIGKQDYVVLYPQVLGVLGSITGENPARLNANAVPCIVHAGRRISILPKEAAQLKIDKIKHMGVLRKVERPTGCCAGILTVFKPSGEV